jgi:large subunit ribosomal protein LX
MADSKVKIFKVSGRYIKNRQYFSFNKFVRALKPEHAMEIVISEITSLKIYRRKVQFEPVKEVSLEECPDTFVHALTDYK